MNKKFLFFTSAVIMCMACPAIAENFPGDGNMLENKTYDNAATYTNTGIYEGTVVANADYSTNNYNVSAGSYFTGLDNSNNATTATCTSGNYCPGVQSTTYSAENSAFVDDGLKACPANYSGSAAGATANTDCYRACSTTDVAKSATVSGQMYYNGTNGDGVNACSAETCVSGWHVKPGVSQAQTDLIGLDNVNSAYAAVDNSGDRTFGNISNYGLSSSDHNGFAIEYEGVGVLRGYGRCSKIPGSNGFSTGGSWDNVTMFDTLTDETGQEDATYCYCNVTGYTPVGGTLQDLSSPWVILMNTGYASRCEQTCASDCATYLIFSHGDYLSFRAAVLGSLPTSPASCEANTINITWNDASAADIAATGAATTVYEGDIKTPLKAVTKPGKTFVGWKFVKPQQ